MASYTTSTEGSFLLWILITPSFDILLMKPTIRTTNGKIIVKREHIGI